MVYKKHLAKRRAAERSRLERPSMRMRKHIQATISRLLDDESEPGNFYNLVGPLKRAGSSFYYD